MAFKTRKRYVFGGDFVMRDSTGEIRRFLAGNELPDNLLPKAELEIHIGHGLFVDADASPPEPATIRPI